jgi:hypothetical protein
MAAGNVDLSLLEKVQSFGAVAVRNNEFDALLFQMAREDGNAGIAACHEQAFLEILSRPNQFDGCFRFAIRFAGCDGDYGVG